jgi:hypothetical protein
MKKVAIGCAAVLGILLVGAIGVSYFVAHKVGSAVSGFAQLGSLPELERSVHKQGSYTPPPSGEPSQAQLDRLLQVQEAVRTRLGARGEEIERRYHELLAKKNATAVDAPQIISAYRDLAAAYMDAKRAQVDALNKADLSLQEYRWTRTKAYAALGIPLMDLDVARIITDMKSGRQPDSTAFQMTVAPTGPTGSPAMKKLVEPHRKVLEANAGLAFFGL